MQIYQVLKNDHKNLKILLKQLVALDKEATNTKDLIEEIRSELVPHSRAEEAVLYNSLRALDTTKGLVMHSYEEHIEAEAMLTALGMKRTIDADWKKTALELKAALEHHIHDEETRVFKTAQQVLSANEAERLAEAFNIMKDEVKQQGFVGTTMDLMVNLLPAKIANSINKSKFTHSSNKHGVQ